MTRLYLDVYVRVREDEETGRYKLTVRDMLYDSSKPVHASEHRTMKGALAKGSKVIAKIKKRWR